MTEKYEQELLAHWAEWEPRFKKESDNSSKYPIMALRNMIMEGRSLDLHCLYRIELLRL